MKMADFFELANRYKRTENVARNTFTSALKRQIEAFNEGKQTNRSWAKEDGAGFTVKLGKLEGMYEIGTKEAVLEFLHSALTAAQTNADFQADVDAAYGEPVAVEKPKRGRKSKAA
jgi:hypothetical protein